MCSGTCGLWSSARSLNHVRQERCIDVPLSRTWTLDLTPHTDANATRRMRNRHWAKLASQAWARPGKRFQAVRVGPACRRPGGGHQGASQNTQGWNLPNFFLRHIISRQILELRRLGHGPGRGFRQFEWDLPADAQAEVIRVPRKIHKAGTYPIFFAAHYFKTDFGMWVKTKMNGTPSTKAQSKTKCWWVKTYQISKALL